jgi:Cys-tRNA(Pro)/Cys-tRNA(Cys) deacylase
MNEPIGQSPIHERVAVALQNSGIAHRVHAHAECAEPIRNADEFARALGVEPVCILKTVFLREQANNGRFALVCCSSTRKLDLKATANVLKYGRMEFAPEAELASELGYPRHGVSPLGAPAHIPVVIDASILELPNVLVGAGIAGYEIALSSADLVAATGATVIQLTRSE